MNKQLTLLDRLTVGITIVRGSVFHEQYSVSTGEKVQIQSGTFTWFWFYAEFSVAFIIACMVSFRSLFVQRANRSSAEREERERRDAAYRSAMRRRQMGAGSGRSGSNGWRDKWHQLHDSVLDTCRSLEGWSGSEADTLAMRGLPTVPSGLMTVDFNDDDNWKRKKSHITTTVTSAATTPRGGEDLEYGRRETHFERVSAERPVSVQSLLENLQEVHLKQDVGRAR